MGSDGGQKIPILPGHPLRMPLNEYKENPH